MNHMLFKAPRFMFIFSMIIFGTLGLFVRNINLSSAELALYRAIMATVLIVGFLLITKQPLSFSLSKKEILLLMFSGMSMGFNWILLFEAYKYTTVSIATLSYYFAPVIVTLICPVLFREKLSKHQIFCFIMSTLGLILITGVGEKGGSNNFKGVLLGLSAAIFYAIVILLNKYIKNIIGIHRTLLQFIFAIIVLIPYVILTEGFSISALDTFGWYNLLVVGFLHTGITYCLYFTSLKELSGQKVAILSYIDPLVAVLISTIFLNEEITLPQMIGGALILGFTLYNEIKSGTS